MTRTDLPVGTITFVFTDIEGSTKLVQELGEAFASVLGDHHRLLRDAFSTHGGVEVVTEGDSFFVVFTSAPAALRAVVAAQRSLAEHGWPDDVEVKVRMGLHTGEGLLVGDNYGGIDVHRAARISAAGHGGQILISNTTRSLGDGSLPGGTQLVDLGEHRLKDIEMPERLFQLSIEGLPQNFPPPRSIDARANNLPVLLTPFVPRDAQVRAIKDLLSSNRCVTLTGPGGTGKTRLSIEVAREVLPVFSGGAFLVPLAPVMDPRLVASEIADALDVREEKERPIVETLKEALADRELLLVLDNFEQVVDAAPLVTELLAAAPGLSCLVTSRIALRIYGEQEYAVPPMSTPTTSAGDDPASFGDYEAVALFVQRAKAVRPDFALTATNARDVASICERLDGLPLAIELIASRVRLLGAGEILQRMGQSSLGLATGARDVPERQRTLRGAIAWSYDLLDEPSRASFRMLSVFAGGWTFSAAESICNPDPDAVDPMEIERTLETLLENSLIRRIEDDRGEARFRMLQTIREYAWELLNETSDAEDVRARHAHFFCELAGAAEPHLTAHGDWADRLAADHDNLRGALRWTLDHGAIDVGMRTASAMWRFWYLRGHLAEGRRWLSELLAAADGRDRSPERGKTLMAIGSISYWQNDFAATRHFYEEGLDIFRELNDEPGVAQALYNLGFVALIEEDRDLAEERFTESRRLHEKLSDRHGVASATWGLAMRALLSDEYDLARGLAEETRRRFIDLGDWYGQGTADFVLYEVERRKGNWDEAVRIMLDDIDRAIEKRDTLMLASVFETMGNIEINRGRTRRGLVLAGASVALKETAGGGAPPALLVVPDARELVVGSIPDEEIAAYFDEGHSLSLEEAIAYLKKDPDSL